ncbi:MAG: alpha/beta hydrolase [Roseovarius sp.]|nr:alpha/beta hydrolase [Roseovarius sp.]
MAEIAMSARVSARGVRYTRRGAGRPVILLHGWCLNRKMWAYAEQGLSASYDVVTPDLPGFGLSCDLAGPYSFDRLAADVVALLDELGLEDAVLVGFALGAAVALKAAAARPGRVAGVVSVAIPSGKASPYDKFAKAMRRDWPGFARKSAEALFHNHHSAAEIGWLERMFSATELAVALEAVDELARLQPESLAKDVEAVQLFLHASHDTVAPVALGKACVAEAPNARLAVIGDCGHLIVLDDKAAFQAELENFINTL